MDKLDPCDLVTPISLEWGRDVHMHSGMDEQVHTMHMESVQCI